MEEFKTASSISVKAKPPLLFLIEDNSFVTCHIMSWKCEIYYIDHLYPFLVVFHS